MTTEAMKQAQHLLRWTHFGECRTYQGPVPEAREVDKLLSEAIATEEAQWVEPVARVKRLTNCSIIDSTGCAVSWEDLPDGSALFTRPVPSPADHIGDATKLVRERAALIAKLRDIPPNPFRLMMWEAADMLAADAQWETESVLIDGIAYTIPSPVAYELLDLHLKLQASDPAQPDNPNKEVDLLHKLGNRLAELLDEDQFSECEDMLLALDAGPWTLKRAQQVAVPQDSALLDHLQQSGSTVEILPGGNSGASWSFRIGGLHAAVHHDIRAAIGLAMLAASPEVNK